MRERTHCREHIYAFPLGVNLANQIAAYTVRWRDINVTIPTRFKYPKSSCWVGNLGWQPTNLGCQPGFGPSLGRTRDTDRDAPRQALGPQAL